MLLHGCSPLQLQCCQRYIPHAGLVTTPMALFQPFRALGYITDDVPFAVQRRGNQTYVTVSVGKAWQVRWWDRWPSQPHACELPMHGGALRLPSPLPHPSSCADLQLRQAATGAGGPPGPWRRRPLPPPAARRRLSRCLSACTALILIALSASWPLQMKHSISALACQGDLTFCAVRGEIVECRRVHRSGVYRGGHAGDILQLLVLGDHLLSLGRDGRLLVWRVGQYDSPVKAIQLPRCGRRAGGEGVKEGWWRGVPQERWRAHRPPTDHDLLLLPAPPFPTAAASPPPAWPTPTPTSTRCWWAARRAACSSGTSPPPRCCLSSRGGAAARCAASRPRPPSTSSPSAWRTGEGRLVGGPALAHAQACIHLYASMHPKQASKGSQARSASLGPARFGKLCEPVPPSTHCPC